MNVKFNQKYKSIVEFNESEIQDFSVFLGINGSGKTHLLKAIHEGFVTVSNIQKEKISYFNFQTFLIKNQKKVAPRNLEDEKMQAWNILYEQKQQFQNFDNQIKTLVGEIKYPYNAEALEEGRKEQYKQIKKQILVFIDNHTKNNPKIRKLLKTGVFESEKYSSEMLQEDFFKFSNYNPDDYELLESLSEIFIDYQKKLVIAGLPKKDGGEDLSDEELSRRKEDSPWSFVNKMFNEFNLLHKVTYPKFNASDLIQNYSSLFQVRLTIEDEDIDFEDLSSGEKILCSLAITMYQDNVSSFPDLLLLDEIDASLHPSMIQNLLNVVSSVFIKNGCKVILATHSPTTVALAPESSLFEIQKGREAKKIRKISQADAINLLSEGIITFEKGLKIQKDIDSTKKMQIVTEGNNTEHIKKAIEVLDNTLSDQIKIVEGAPDKRGQQLKNAFDVMSSGYYNEKFLFVWDCDCAPMVGQLVETENFKTFCFAENVVNTKRGEDGKAKGIENLYSESLFTEDVYSTTEIALPYGGSKTEKKFDRQKFLRKIQMESSTDVFQNFRPLAEKIKELLNPNN